MPIWIMNFFLQIINGLSNDYIGNNPLQSIFSHLLITLDSPVLRNVTRLFNITEGIIVYRSHHTVIPSSSQQISTFKIIYIEIIIISINIEISLWTFSLLFHQSSRLEINYPATYSGDWISYKPKSQSRKVFNIAMQCCGPQKYIQDHITRIHKGSFAPLATPVLLK
jgi:hypothetical protein